MTSEIKEKKVQPSIPLSKQEEKLLNLVDKNENEIVTLLQNLVRINSLNTSEYEFFDKKEIFEFVDDFMKKLDIKTELFKAPFTSGKKTEFYYNLIASMGEETSKKVLQFNGHLDIVPFNPANWDPETPPLSGSIKEGKLYGRGSIDMKAGVACQMIAMKILQESGQKIKGKLQMWFTPDEETHGKFGSKYMTKNHFDKINADGTIISEPSVHKPIRSPSIGIGEKGPHWLKFTFHGVAGHGSWPKKKSNALKKAARFMIKADNRLKIPNKKPPLTKLQSMRLLISKVGLINFIRVQRFKPEKLPLDKDKRDRNILYKTTFSFNEIKAGIKTNVIPDTCELSVDFRAMPGLTTQELFDSIVKFCSKLKYRIKLPEGYSNIQDSSKKWDQKPVDVTLSLITIGEGSASNPDSEVGKIIKESYEAVYKTIPTYHFNTGFSDGGNMREAGMKNIFVFGPGGRNAHNANEYTDLDTLVDITKLYLLIVFRYLK